tara:strand:- start:147 stop:530 length:384 start_codon:yes stop_codon:yes gene_type:complete
MTESAKILPNDIDLRVKVIFEGQLTLGPGKADLLELIRETGSISAAGRAMSMSYKRAWSLVEEMNAAFRDPLVASARGGAQGGGAHLTEAGEAVLAHFRKLQDITAEAGAARINALQEMLKDMAHEK